MSQGSVGQGIGAMEKRVWRTEKLGRSPDSTGRRKVCFFITAYWAGVHPLARVVYSVEGSVYGVRLLQLPILHAKRSGE